MTDNKLTDSEIIKALECCTTNGASCKDCPAFVKVDRSNCKKYFRGALDLINRLQAENERLNKKLIEQQLKNNMLYETSKEIEIKAYKEFSKMAIDRVEKAKAKYQRLCKEQGEEMEEHMHIHFNGIIGIICNLLKELVGE